MTDPDPARLARGWIWRRAHGASVGEAVALATDLPDIDPRDPGTGVHLANHRAAGTCPRPHRNDHEGVDR